MPEFDLSAHHLSVALQQFRLVPSASDPILPALAGLDAITNLWDIPGAWREEHCGLINRVCDNILDARPRLMEATSRELAPDHVAFLMAAAPAFLSPFDTSLRFDQFLHVGLIRSEFAAIVFRREIAARGDPLFRHIQINRALAAEPADQIVQ